VRIHLQLASQYDQQYTTRWHCSRRSGKARLVTHLTAGLLTNSVQSGRGIGKEAAFSLAEAGAKVVFADMDEETAKASSEESKQYASNKDYVTTTFEMNVQDADSVQNMVDFVVAKYGRLDYCVNGAGVSATRLLLLQLDSNGFSPLSR
jgi:short-subunit dehydrogenase involved in D-alanine esterification of teichoic acids